jgi:hypothetical protein
MAQTVDGITVGENITFAQASVNTTAITSALQAGAEAVLPPGRVEVFGSPKFPANKAFRLIGQNTALHNKQAAPAVQAFAPLFGYTSWSDIAMTPYIGERVYLFKFGDWFAQPRSRIATVTGIRGGQPVCTPPMLPTDSVLRFGNLWPCEPAGEGATRVTLRQASPGIHVGQTLYVTDGPSADAARGEHRTVTAVQGNVVTLDLPLSLSFGETAALAWTAPLSGVVEGVNLSTAPNGGLVNWAAAYKGCSNLAVMNCDHEGVCDVISSTGVLLTGIGNGPVQMNTSTAVILENSVVGCVYLEEDVSSIIIRRSYLGVNRPEPQNVITGFFRVSGVKVQDTTITGAGRPEWPPPASLIMSGSNFTLQNVTQKHSRGGWAVIGGEDIYVSNVVTDGGFDVVTGSKRVSINHLRGPYTQLLPTDKANLCRAIDCDNVTNAQGWQQVACSPWVQPSGVAGKMLAALGITSQPPQVVHSQANRERATFYAMRPALRPPAPSVAQPVPTAQ